MAGQNIVLTTSLALASQLKPILRFSRVVEIGHLAQQAGGEQGHEGDQEAALAAQDGCRGDEDHQADVDVQGITRQVQRGFEDVLEIRDGGKKHAGGPKASGGPDAKATFKCERGTMVKTDHPLRLVTTNGRPRPMRATQHQTLLPEGPGSRPIPDA